MHAAAHRVGNVLDVRLHDIGALFAHERDEIGRLTSGNARANSRPSDPDRAQRRPKVIIICLDSRVFCRPDGTSKKQSISVKYAGTLEKSRKAIMSALFLLMAMGSAWAGPAREIAPLQDPEVTLNAAAYYVRQCLREHPGLPGADSLYTGGQG